uniref:Uncharacterized protein n=1 Tax=Maylandia zebra TaxID=106582 RepID=A0A3P9BWC3_9CICH
KDRGTKKRRMKYFKNKNKTSSDTVKDTVNHTSDVAWDLSGICQILVGKLTLHNNLCGESPRKKMSWLAVQHIAARLNFANEHEKVPDEYWRRCNETDCHNYITAKSSLLFM